MRYAEARFNQSVRDKVYRIYITDALKILGRLNVRYIDYVQPNTKPEETPEEIIGRIRGKLSGRGG